MTDGSHTVMARATDGSGNETNSAVVMFSSDNTGPATSVTALAAGSTVGQQSVTVSATASDASGVAHVDFFDGSTLIGSAASSPYSVAWSTVGLSGSHTLTSVAYDTVGNSTVSAGVTVTVATALSAVYDTTLQAPKCATLGVSCDTGTLVVGRGPLGPELNFPNTIASSCADGTAGKFHKTGESLDRLVVSTIGGGPLVPGAQVQVSATVWAVNGNDHLDIWRAASATNPTWVLVGTVDPTVPVAAATLQMTFTLLAGSLQAVAGIASSKRQSDRMPDVSTDGDPRQ